MVDGIVYAITEGKNLVALDAGTGRQKWYLDFRKVDSTGRQGTARGLQYWERGEERRIYYVYAANLYAVQAQDGTLIRSFGENGSVSIAQGLDLSSDLTVAVTTPGVIYQDLLILGSMVSERLPAAPGHIRAFDLHSGELVWVFHTIPHPGEVGYDTWPEEAYLSVGGANNWAGMSLDVKRGIVYVPTGSATFDFYGANRLGQNLFANCLLALDAKTGQRLWHFQTVHHDLWDRDLPCPPNLLQIRHEGKKRDVVVQASKQGFLFIFDRETGEPIFQIEEVPTPPSNTLGEVAWPTQPVPTWPLPFTRQEFTEDLITDISPEATAYVREQLAGLQTRRFQPPDTIGVILHPSFAGGAGWGGAAVDESSRTLVINANDVPGILQLYDQQKEMLAKKLTGPALYGRHCASCHGDKRQGTHFYPPLIHIMNKYSPGEIKDIVQKGTGLMPAFPFLSQGEREAIVAFLAGKETEKGAMEVPNKAGSLPTRLAYAHRGNRDFKDQNGYPAIKAPWATLTAYDIDSWEIKWQKPLGNYEHISGPKWQDIGTLSSGGPIITAGGLVLIASTADQQIRAFDIDTGEILWQYHLSGRGTANPISYEWEGKQYLLIAVSGDREQNLNGQYVAFRLP